MARIQNWDLYFTRLVQLVSQKSKDPSTQVGCVIVGPDREIRSTGYNGLPRGCKDDLPERNERPQKYDWYECAERNAIYNAARMGTPLLGCTAYVVAHPCICCARALIQAGIAELVYPEVNPISHREDWEERIAMSNEMLREAGVRIRCLTKEDLAEEADQKPLACTQ